MMKFLVNCTHPEMAYDVHQYARFCNDTRLSYEQAVNKVIRYLLGVTLKDRSNKTVSNQGIICKTDRNKSIDTCEDTSFTGYWNMEWSQEPTSVKPSTIFVVLFANCLLIRCSKIQTEIVLSTIESKYIALS